MKKSFAHFDNMCWPILSDKLNEVQWKLRCSAHQLTREDQLCAAEVLSAYFELINCPRRKRDYVIRNIKKEMKR